MSNTRRVDGWSEIAGSAQSNLQKTSQHYTQLTTTTSISRKASHGSHVDIAKEDGIRLQEPSRANHCQLCRKGLKSNPKSNSVHVNNSPDNDLQGEFHSTLKMVIHSSGARKCCCAAHGSGHNFSSPNSAMKTGLPSTRGFPNSRWIPSSTSYLQRMAGTEHGQALFVSVFILCRPSCLTTYNIIALRARAILIQSWRKNQITIFA